MPRFIAPLVIFSAIAGAPAWAQDTPGLLQSMAGTWEVQQRMWPAPGATAIELPPAKARRQLVDGKYLEEVMEPAAEGPGAFRRDALLTYNPVARRYEYTSLDSRAPQLMTEIGPRVEAPAAPATLALQGGVFTAAEWGPAKNVPFSYRLTIGPVQTGRQTVQLYLTPQGVLPRQEFLAFEYVYSRRP